MRGISRMKEPQYSEDLCWVIRFAAAEAGAAVNDLPAPVQGIRCGDEQTSVWVPLIRRLDELHIAPKLPIFLAQHPKLDVEVVLLQCPNPPNGARPQFLCQLDASEGNRRGIQGTNESMRSITFRS